jgi:Spy/CpxP family protein refolding chaperone
MGFALPAELNGYPGPIHVLELADKLDLAEPQRAQVRALHEAMKAEAIPLGERLIALEAELERLFAGRTVTPASLATTTDAIGATQAALRRAHLKYHLATADILAPAQARRYAELRGYARPGVQPHHNGSRP